jgi:hypothetical protein
MNQHPDVPEPPLPELGSLPREMAPPPGLESRVIAELRQQSLLRPAARSPWVQAAAALLLLSAGVMIGRLSAGPVPDRSNAVTAGRFLLMLTGADTSGDDAARAEQYRLWAVDQRSAGREISGERLAASGMAVTRAGSGPVTNPEVQGYFVVSAASLEDAAAVARSSPHVQSGGIIIVRPIDTP